MKKIKIGLLPRIILAIALGIAFGNILPGGLVRIFVTFNGIFSEFLGFIIPLIILGLVTPAIADIGKEAGKMLVVTTLVAYGATLFSGFLSYFTGITFFPSMITPGASIEQISEAHDIIPFFTVAIPPAMNVMTSLILAFTLGLGIAHLDTTALKNVCNDFKDIIIKTIQVIILPLLPIYIFGIFLNMTHSGQVMSVLSVFIKIIGVIFLLHIFLLVFQYSIAALFVRRNPFRLLGRMLPAYFTALGTQSSAACHYSSDSKAKHQERCERRHCRFCNSALCHDSFIGQHPEDSCMRIGADDDAGNAFRFSHVCRIYLYARHYNGSRTGRSGWCDYGCTGHPLFYAGFR